MTIDPPARADGTLEWVEPITGISTRGNENVLDPVLWDARTGQRIAGLGEGKEMYISPAPRPAPPSKVIAWFVDALLPLKGSERNERSHCRGVARQRKICSPTIPPWYHYSGSQLACRGGLERMAAGCSGSRQTSGGLPPEVWRLPLPLLPAAGRANPRPGRVFPFSFASLPAAGL